MNEIGTLKEKEAHPMAHDAFAFVKDWIVKEGSDGLSVTKEALASTAISGNRTSEVCGETLNRILRGEAVSDRYVLGLAWFIRNFERQRSKEKKVSKCCNGRMVGGVQCEVCGSDGN